MLFANYKVSPREEVVEFDALKLNASLIWKNSLYSTDLSIRCGSSMRHYKKTFKQSRNKMLGANGCMLKESKAPTPRSLKGTISTESSTLLENTLRKKCYFNQSVAFHVKSKLVMPCQCNGDVDQ